MSKKKLLDRPDESMKARSCNSDRRRMMAISSALCAVIPVAGRAIMMRPPLAAN
jgi:hypothetical protein